MTPPAGVADPAKRRHFRYNAFKSKHASSVSISEVIDTGVNSNLYATAISPTIPDEVSAP